MGDILLDLMALIWVVTTAAFVCVYCSIALDRRRAGKAEKEQERMDAVATADAQFALSMLRLDDQLRRQTAYRSLRAASDKADATHGEVGRG